MALDDSYRHDLDIERSTHRLGPVARAIHLLIIGIPSMVDALNSADSKVLKLSKDERVEWFARLAAKSRTCPKLHPLFPKVTDRPHVEAGSRKVEHRSP